MRFYDPLTFMQSEKFYFCPTAFLKKVWVLKRKLKFALKSAGKKEENIAIECSPSGWQGKKLLCQWIKKVQWKPTGRINHNEECSVWAQEEERRQIWATGEAVMSHVYSYCFLLLLLFVSTRRSDHEAHSVLFVWLTIAGWRCNPHRNQTFFSCANFMPVLNGNSTEFS